MSSFLTSNAPNPSVSTHEPDVGCLRSFLGSLKTFRSKRGSNNPRTLSGRDDSRQSRLTSRTAGPLEACTAEAVRATSEEQGSTTFPESGYSLREGDADPLPELKLAQEAFDALRREAAANVVPPGSQVVSFLAFGKLEGLRRDIRWQAHQPGYLTDRERLALIALALPCVRGDMGLVQQEVDAFEIGFENPGKKLSEYTVRELKEKGDTIASRMGGDASLWNLWKGFFD